MAKWNVSTRIWLAFGGVVLITMVFSIQIYHHIDSVRTKTEEFTKNTWPGLGSITQLDSAVRNTYSLMNRVALDSDVRKNREDTAQIQTMWTAIDTHLKQYEQTLEGGEDRRL